VSLLILAYHEIFGSGGEHPLIRFLGLLALFLNAPYYLAVRTGRWLRLQAHVRMLTDIALITLGLWSAGGLAAARYVGLYTVIPVAAGILLSSGAGLVAAGVATLSYLAVALFAPTGRPPAPGSPALTDWAVAAFNLLVVNLVGGLTAFLANVHHRNRRRLGALYQELERAHDELLRLTVEMQRAAELRALGQVAAGMAHEIRNALTVASGQLRLVRRRAEPFGPEVAQHLDGIERSYGAALRIVTSALETARQPAAEKIRVSLAAVAQRLADLKGYDLHRKEISLRLDFPPDFPLVLANPVQLQQVLLNLIMNAEEALGETTGPRAIELVGLVEAERAVLEVRDTGPGIPPTVLPRLFEPFYTTKAQGTGLGLAIAAGIVRDLGGELTAANRPEGGAAFRVSLPATRLDRAAPA
jgi:signal transduction histidine kinase